MPYREVVYQMSSTKIVRSRKEMGEIWQIFRKAPVGRSRGLPGHRVMMTGDRQTIPLLDSFKQTSDHHELRIYED